MKKLCKLVLVSLLLLAIPTFAATNQQAQKSLSLTVVSQLTITTASLPSAVVGQPYSTTLAAAGGVTPYSWAVSTGTGQTGLPTGLALSAAGVLAGTVPSSACPVGPCTFTATFTVTDSSGNLAQVEVKAEILAAKLTMPKN